MPGGALNLVRRQQRGETISRVFTVVSVERNREGRPNRFRIRTGQFESFQRAVEA